ncbi:MAG TPA: lysylphosphatidylglycerol synthase domain-containing protein [Solirubrobacteraceae bacterium]|nr:lysylphosphatidylglycerol synthase domain-containing protein [Solirubrobacteraceae bacterium]
MEPQSSTEQTSSPERDAHLLRNGIIWTVALLVLLLAVGLAVPDLREVLDRAAHAQASWLIVAVVLEVASCLGYVATVRLVLRRGPRRDVRWLAWAEMAFGAVVPVGGAGGLAVGAWAMRAWGISWSRIANRSAVIFLLTSAVNGVVLMLAGLGIAAGLGASGKGIEYGVIPAVATAAGLGFFLALPQWAERSTRVRRGSGGRLTTALVRAAQWVSDSEAMLRRPDWRLLGTVGYLLFDIAVLWACLRAVGVTPSVLAVVVGYQVGYLANLIPIPGGVGVLEGGLLGALLLYGLPAAPTAAAVVLYHAIALWVPSLGGTIGFARLRRAVTTRAPLIARAGGAQPESALEPAEIAA